MLSNEDKEKIQKFIKFFYNINKRDIPTKKENCKEEQLEALDCDLQCHECDFFGIYLKNKSVTLVSRGEYITVGFDNNSIYYKGNINNWQGYRVKFESFDEFFNSFNEWCEDFRLSLSDFTLNESTTKVTQNFIYKIDDSNKLNVQTGYSSIDEYFNEPITNDIKLDTLMICPISTNIPLIKIEKVEKNNNLNYKFIVEITNEDGDDFIIRSIIQNKEQLNELIIKTVESLRLYSQFSKYADDLEKCII